MIFVCHTQPPVDRQGVTNSRCLAGHRSARTYGHTRTRATHERAHNGAPRREVGPVRCVVSAAEQRPNQRNVAWRRVQEAQPTREFEASVPRKSLPWSSLPPYPFPFSFVIHVVLLGRWHVLYRVCFHTRPLILFIDTLFT